jgi:membrane protease subunit HflC
MSTKVAITLLALLALVVAYSGAIFVDETELVIVTQFGEYKRTLEKPGLAFKIPLVQTETRIDRRIQASDAPPEEYLTLDKKRLVADPITRWRVTDALLYYKTVGDEARARQRLDDVVRSELRQELASYDFGDIIGNSRGPLMDKVSERARAKAKEFGIEVVDVRIKRADLPAQVQQSVYSRMKAERERQAKEYRSEGQEESDKITSEADKEREIILAKAYREAQVLQGEGDAEATRIYAEAYAKDPEFYAFTRNLQLYEASIDASSTLVLSTRSDLLQYLTKAGAGEGERAR